MTEFVKSCEEKREKVCMEVTEMWCEVGDPTDRLIQLRTDPLVTR